MDLVIVIAVFCFLGGVVAASRWLPELAPGPLATLTFFLVCGLFGAALSIFGINVDNLVRVVESAYPDDVRTTAVANVLAAMLRDSGTVAALALLLFLLAPKPARGEHSDHAMAVGEPSPGA